MPSVHAWNLTASYTAFQSVRWRTPIPNPEKGGILIPEIERRKGASETILVAEDDPIFRRLLQSRLQNWGYHVITAKDGAEAWELLQQAETPDLLILDWMMPGLDGLELCRRIRNKERDRYQYILLLTGKDEKQDVVNGLNSGADDYLTKPFDIGELEARLRAGKRILSLQHELIQAREDLRFQATHDALTGLWSRGATLDLLRSELRRAVRPHTSTGILMADLDHFKNINDTYGHLIGDAVLKEASRRISQAVRSYDFVGRYGGEEFLTILSKCTMDDLQTVAERMRSAVADTPFSTSAGDIKVTVSIGAVVAPVNAPDLEMLGIADSALYEAKHSGRNRVVIGKHEDSLSIVSELETKESLQVKNG
jgi:two-component system cell cycle response regulator